MRKIQKSEKQIKHAVAPRNTQARCVQGNRFDLANLSAVADYVASLFRLALLPPDIVVPLSAVAATTKSASSGLAARSQAE